MHGPLNVKFTSCFPAILNIRRSFGK